MVARTHTVSLDSSGPVTWPLCEDLRLETPKVEHRRSIVTFCERESCYACQRKAAGRGWIRQDITSELESDAKLLSGRVNSVQTPKLACADNHREGTFWRSDQFVESVNSVVPNLWGSVHAVSHHAHMLSAAQLDRKVQQPGPW